MAFGEPFKRARGASVSGLMARKLMERGAKGKIIDRTLRRSDGKTGKQRPMPASLAKFFRPIGGA